MAWLNAAEALALLGTARQTLYANVSRGRIRARRDPADPRKSLYHEADVRRLASRGTGRRNVAALAAETIHWGDPILPSAISTIAGGHLIYRGRDAIDWAGTAGLEETAALLWQAEAVDFASHDLPMPPARAESPLAASFVALAQLAASALPAMGRTPAASRQDARAAIARLAGALAGPGELPLHERLAACWRRPLAAEPLRKALVLLADHELNASTFACRIAASTGTSIAGALLAGLATLNGPRHGGASSALFALVDQSEDVGAAAAISHWLARGHPLPAFGHALYPDGDIRAAALVDSFDLPPLYAELATAAEALLVDPPNIDFALAALSDAFGLPRTAPMTIFTLARAVGWAAHALEQQADGTLIRPRARYIGTMPESVG